LAYQSVSQSYQSIRSSVGVRRAGPSISFDGAAGGGSHAHSAAAATLTGREGDATPAIIASADD